MQFVERNTLGKERNAVDSFNIPLILLSMVNQKLTSTGIEPMCGLCWRLLTKCESNVTSYWWRKPEAYREVSDCHGICRRERLRVHVRKVVVGPYIATVP